MSLPCDCPWTTATDALDGRRGRCQREATLREALQAAVDALANGGSMDSALAQADALDIVPKEEAP